MFWIIVNLCVFAVNIAATVVNYQNGIYDAALATGGCAGAVFFNIIWMIKKEIEE